MEFLREIQMFKKFVVAFVACLLSGQILAGDSWVQDAKIEKVEFYGNQFTVYFNKPHSSNACGHPGNVVAMNSAAEPGKTHYSFFLAAYTAKKTVSVKVTDDNCYGDRPTIKVITGTH